MGGKKVLIEKTLDGDKKGRGGGRGQFYKKILNFGYFKKWEINHNKIVNFGVENFEHLRCVVKFEVEILS